MSVEQRTLLRTTLAVKLAAQWGSRVKRLHAPFQSEYGEGVVPILLQDEKGERAVYVDVAPWTWRSQEECLRWLGLVRTSDQEDLPVEIHSNAEVPEIVSFYAERSLRNSFELEGLLCMRWGTDGFARENAANLGRLAEKHLGISFAAGVEGLTTLDECVLEYFKPTGHMLPSTTILLGSLLGETLIARHGGEWLMRGEELEEAIVALPARAGLTEVNVFGKVMKLFHNGIEDSTAAMEVGLEDVLRR